jgi:hypothetical protein
MAADPLLRCGEPIEKGDFGRFTRLASGRSTLVASSVHCEDDATALLPADKAQRILQYFPLDDDGRLPLKTTALLAPFGEPPPTERNRSLWLVAFSPDRRTDPQMITAGLRWIIPENERHRWEHRRWMWDATEPVPGRAERWGIAFYDRKVIGLEDRDQQLKAACDLNDSTARAARSLLLLDAGRFGDAFDLYGIEVAPEVWSVLNRQMFVNLTPEVTAAWAAAVARAFHRCAPWLLASAFHLRKRKYDKIAILPKQTQQSKLSLMLSAPGDGTARLYLESTASNANVPAIAWERPIDLDLWRFLGVPAGP